MLNHEAIFFIQMEYRVSHSQTNSSAEQLKKRALDLASGGYPWYGEIKSHKAKKMFSH